MPAGEKPHGDAAVKCATCDDVGWVCENHPDRPWDGPRACTCGGAGAPMTMQRFKSASHEAQVRCRDAGHYCRGWPRVHLVRWGPFGLAYRGTLSDQGERADRAHHLVP